MSSTRHGLSIGIERVGETFFLSMKAIGKLTHEDYLAITPMLEASLATVDKPKVIALFDGQELDGWELRAAWDDFKIGLKHGSEFEKIAILGNKRWQELAAKVGPWFISGEVKYFESEDEAIAWLKP